MQLQKQLKYVYINPLKLYKKIRKIFTLGINIGTIMFKSFYIYFKLLSTSFKVFCSTNHWHLNSCIQALQGQCSTILVINMIIIWNVFAQIVHSNDSWKISVLQLFRLRESYYDIRSAVAFSNNSTDSITKWPVILRNLRITHSIVLYFKVHCSL